MPTRKVSPEELKGAEIVIPACRHSDHVPKTERLAPGLYEHHCDGCGAWTTFTIAANERKG